MGPSMQPHPPADAFYAPHSHRQAAHGYESPSEAAPKGQANPKQGERSKVTLKRFQQHFVDYLQICVEAAIGIYNDRQGRQQEIGTFLEYLNSHKVTEIPASLEHWYNIGKAFVLPSGWYNPQKGYDDAQASKNSVAALEWMMARVASARFKALNAMWPKDARTRTEKWTFWRKVAKTCGYSPKLARDTWLNWISRIPGSRSPSPSPSPPSSRSPSPLSRSEARQTGKGRSQGPRGYHDSRSEDSVPYRSRPSSAQRDRDSEWLEVELARFLQTQKEPNPRAFARWLDRKEIENLKTPPPLLGAWYLVGSAFHPAEKTFREDLFKEAARQGLSDAARSNYPKYRQIWILMEGELLQALWIRWKEDVGSLRRYAEYQEWKRRTHTCGYSVRRCEYIWRYWTGAAPPSAPAEDYDSEGYTTEYFDQRNHNGADWNGAGSGRANQKDNRRKSSSGPAHGHSRAPPKAIAPLPSARLSVAEKAERIHAHLAAKENLPQTPTLNDLRALWAAYPEDLETEQKEVTTTTTVQNKVVTNTQTYSVPNHRAVVTFVVDMFALRPEAESALKVGKANNEWWCRVFYEQNKAKWNEWTAGLSKDYRHLRPEAPMWRPPKMHEAAELQGQRTALCNAVNGVLNGLQGADVKDIIDAMTV